MRKYGYLVVEGPHDVELIYRLLKPHGLDRVRLEKDLDDFLRPLIPRNFPQNGDLLKRVNVPTFLQSPRRSVAVHAAQGESRLMDSIQETGATIDIGKFIGVGVILDSDSTKPASRRYEEARNKLREKGFKFPDQAGSIGKGTPNFGGFVLPNNQGSGTLEDLLLESAGKVYPKLLESAKQHVEISTGSDSGLNSDERKEIKKQSGKNKAVVASIASILKPGRAVQVSLQDNRWFGEAALEIPRIKAVQEFLVNLLELTGPSNSPGTTTIE
jgi:hypothetical protein